jgi:hypothetical protein
VKNSDVGYTSLYVIPTLTMSMHAMPVVMESKAVLKRIHRGKIDLGEKFEEAFTQCSMMWVELAAKLPHLASKSYRTKDAAITAMTTLLTSILATKEFILKCTRAYGSVPRRDTALDIFEAVAEVSATYTDRDDSYAMGSIAGAILAKLVF